MFARTPVVTPRTSLQALRLKLWDEERRCLVRYPTRRAGSAAAKPVSDAAVASASASPPIA